jgi:hypothetical protein
MGRRTRRLMEHQRSMARESMLGSLISSIIGQGINVASQFGQQAYRQDFQGEQNQAARENSYAQNQVSQEGQTDRAGIREGQQTARRFKELSEQSARAQAERESRENLAEQKDWGGYLGDVQEAAGEVGQPGEGSEMAGAGREGRYQSPQFREEWKNAMESMPDTYGPETSKTSPEAMDEPKPSLRQRMAGAQPSAFTKTEQAQEFRRAFGGFPQQKKESQADLIELRSKARMKELERKHALGRASRQEQAELRGLLIKYKTEADVGKRAATLNLEGQAKPLDLMQQVQDPGYEAPEPPREIGGRGVPSKAPPGGAPTKPGKFSGKVKTYDEMVDKFRALYSREPGPNDPEFVRLMNRFKSGGGKITG